MKLILNSVKGKVAVASFPDMSVKTTVRGAGSVKVAYIENKTELVHLPVLFYTEDARFGPGDTVLVRGSHFTAPWAKEIFEHDGQKFILVPETYVEAFIREVHEYISDSR
jgi:hypothetical protein